ncbi:hypothetical protein O181_053406 [Austropuccinia psidii MF-1]|uniref:Uncharacterized protein n=1 Tax=Austropuccinia psidii MF-1 TaxID=1389203 RepID=A0A9Q3E0D7_9BASI|nr:hypothetical protein [Austropuccinia psidii MF-1]
MHINPEGHQGSGPMTSLMAPQGPHYGAPISKSGPPLQLWGSHSLYGPGPLTMGQNDPFCSLETPGTPENLGPRELQ